MEVQFHEMEQQLAERTESERGLKKELHATKQVLNETIDELNLMNEDQAQFEVALQECQMEIATLSAKVQLKEKNLTEAVDELTEMEQLIISIRQLLDDKTADNGRLHRHVAELQAELVQTQNQVLELADIVECDKKALADEKIQGSVAADDAAALVLKLNSTEAELASVRQSRDLAQAGKAQMEHEIVSEKALINDSRKEFEAWHAEMDDKQRLRDQLEQEQERLVTSLEENLATKKKELTLLAAEKQAEHLENSEKIASLHKSIEDERKAHTDAVQELEEQEAVAIAAKDAEIAGIREEFSAATQAWAAEKAELIVQHKGAMEKQKGVYEDRISTLNEEHEQAIFAMTEVHQAEVESLNERYDALKQADAERYTALQEADAEQLEAERTQHRNEREADHAAHRKAMQDQEDRHEAMMADKNREIEHLRECESDLYDVEIELSILQAKHTKLEQEWDSRMKWRKDHDHSAPSKAWYPPDTPNPGFKNVDVIYAAPEQSTEPVKRTFTKSSNAFRKLMSPRPKPALNLGSTKKLTSHYAQAESKLKTSGLIGSTKPAPMGSLIPTPLKRPVFKAPLKSEKAPGKVGHVSPPADVDESCMSAVSSQPTTGMTKEEIDAEIAKLGDDDLAAAPLSLSPVDNAAFPAHRSAGAWSSEDVLPGWETLWVNEDDD